MSSVGCALGHGLEALLLSQPGAWGAHEGSVSSDSSSAGSEFQAPGHCAGSGISCADPLVMSPSLLMAVSPPIPCFTDCGLFTSSAWWLPHALFWVQFTAKESPQSWGSWEAHLCISVSWEFQPV